GVGGGGGMPASSSGRLGARPRRGGPAGAPALPTARALVLAARAADAGPVVIDAVDRPDWRVTLEAEGFRAQRPLVRMYRHAQPPGRPERQFAVFGPEFG